MLSCGFEREPELLPYRARAEEEDHDEGVREADFGAVNCAIPYGFEEDQGLLVGRIQDDLALQIFLSLCVRCGGLDDVTCVEIPGWLEGCPSLRTNGVYQTAVVIVFALLE